MEKTLTQLCKVTDVGPDLPLRVRIDGTSYAVFQAGREYFVTEDQCSHGPGLLSEGFVEGWEVECPFHGGRFDLRTGEPTAPPCTKSIRVWSPRIVNGFVCIENSEFGIAS